MSCTAGVCPERTVLIMSRNSLAILIAGFALLVASAAYAQSDDMPAGPAGQSSQAPYFAYRASVPGVDSTPAAPSNHRSEFPKKSMVGSASVRPNGRRRVRLEADDLRLRRGRRNVGLHPELQRRIEQQRGCASHHAGQSQPAPASHHSKQPARDSKQNLQNSTGFAHRPCSSSTCLAISRASIAAGDRLGSHRAPVPRPKPRISNNAAFRVRHAYLKIEDDFVDAWWARRTICWGGRITSSERRAVFSGCQ